MGKIYTLIFYYVILILIGCIDDEKKKRDEYPRIEDSELSKSSDIVYYQDKPFTGIGFEMFETQQLSKETYYKEGKKDGPEKGYYPTGQLRSESINKKGKLEKTYKQYYKTGQLMMEGAYNDNERVGPWKEYFVNGQVRLEGTFLNGKQGGIIKEYSMSGELISERDYTEGKLIGEKIYDERKIESDLYIKFKDIINYLIDADQNIILQDLKDKNYLIEDEEPSAVKIFDTQIKCFKPSDNNIFEVNGIVLFKVLNKISAISYFTFSTNDFQNKIDEIYKLGYKQKIINPKSHWVFESSNTVITVEKKDITMNNKEVIRYEFSIAYVNSK